MTSSPLHSSLQFVCKMKNGYFKRRFFLAFVSPWLKLGRNILHSFVVLLAIQNNTYHIHPYNKILNIITLKILQESQIHYHLFFFKSVHSLFLHISINSRRSQFLFPYYFYYTRILRYFCTHLRIFCAYMADLIN